MVLCLWCELFRTLDHFQLCVLVWKEEELDYISFKTFSSSKILCISDSKMNQRLQAWVVGSYSFINGHTLIGKGVVKFLKGKYAFSLHIPLSKCILALYQTSHHKDPSNPFHLFTNPSSSRQSHIPIPCLPYFVLILHWVIPYSFANVSSYTVVCNCQFTYSF